MSEQAEKFDQWAVVEIMGHQRFAGRVSEATIGGAGLIRVDVPEIWEARPNPQDKLEFGQTTPKRVMDGFTKFFGPQAIYCITPVTEEVARAIASQLRVRPVEVYGETRRLVASTREEDDSEEGGIPF